MSDTYTFNVSDCWCLALHPILVYTILLFVSSGLAIMRGIVQVCLHSEASLPVSVYLGD